MQEEEPDTNSVSDNDTNNSTYEDNLDEDLVETPNTFAELKPLLNYTAAKFKPEPFDRTDTLKNINQSKLDQTDKDNKKIEQYNKLNVSTVTLPLS